VCSESCDQGHPLSLLRFVSSTVGVGLLMMIVLTIGGIVRGIILDSSTIVKEIGADLWVVQRGWLGPLVEISRFPEEGSGHFPSGREGGKDARSRAVLTNLRERT